MDAGAAGWVQQRIRIPGCRFLPSYKTINVETEQRDPNSQLEWYEHLIALRRSNHALREGALTMVDASDPNVLSYVRTTGAGQPAVVVAMNFTAEPRTISLDLKGTEATGKTVRTLLTDAPSLAGSSSLENITLPPFASWIAEVE